MAASMTRFDFDYYTRENNVRKNVPDLSMRKRAWRLSCLELCSASSFCIALPAIRVVLALAVCASSKGPTRLARLKSVAQDTRKKSTHKLLLQQCIAILLTRDAHDKAASMDESLTGKSMDESLTGRPPFKPLGLPHRITSSNSATNLHGTDELDDSDRDGRVLVLLTGGTMGMKPNARGSLEPKAGYLAEQMRLMPELRERRMPAYEVVEYAPLLDSADMVPQDWRRIAQDIAQSHNQFDGFVVIMGTDTMAYCASALSFMLEGLSKPVVLTGSMIPFAESYSDARRNLVMALIFAHAGPSEVVVFLGIGYSGATARPKSTRLLCRPTTRRIFLRSRRAASHLEQGTTWRWRRRRSEDVKRSHRWRRRS